MAEYGKCRESYPKALGYYSGGKNVGHKSYHGKDMKWQVSLEITFQQAKIGGREVDPRMGAMQEQ